VIPEKAFYVHPDYVRSESFVLDKIESHHVSNVFRLIPGDSILLINGLGIGYIGKIKVIKEGIVSGTIKKKIEGLGESSHRINIVPAIIKRDNFENLLQKVTELGVRNIYPIVTDRCIKRTINKKRCEKIIISAAKQCQRSLFPAIHKPIDIESWLVKSNDQVYTGKRTAISKLSNLNIKKDKSISIIIGPEGDFNQKEMKNMEKFGVQFFNLGDRRLRSDTAAYTSLSILNELFS
tara:strand:+ start:30 stop:737 length:708 start_codon:yes stop_codon:yes gene_type:complete